MQPDARDYSKKYFQQERDEAAQSAVQIRAEERQRREKQVTRIQKLWQQLLTGLGIPQKRPLDPETHQRVREVVTALQDTMVERMQLDEQTKDVREFIRQHQLYLIHVLDINPVYDSVQRKHTWREKLDYLMGQTDGATISTSTVSKDDLADAVVHMRDEPMISVWLKGGEIQRAYPTDAGTSAFGGTHSSDVMDKRWIDSTPLHKQADRAVLKNEFSPWNEFVVHVRPQDIGGICISLPNPDTSYWLFEKACTPEVLELSEKYDLPIVMLTAAGYFRRANIFRSRLNPEKYYMQRDGIANNLTPEQMRYREIFAHRYEQVYDPITVNVDNKEYQGFGPR